MVGTVVLYTAAKHVRPHPFSQQRCPSSQLESSVQESLRTRQMDTTSEVSGHMGVAQAGQQALEAQW